MYSPLWIRRCSFRWCLYLNALPHSLHLNLRFPADCMTCLGWTREEGTWWDTTYKEPPIHCIYYRHYYGTNSSMSCLLGTPSNIFFSRKFKLTIFSWNTQKCDLLSPFSLHLASFIPFYLIASTLVSRHVPFKQSAVREAAAAFRAAEGLLGLLVAVPDVLLQWAVALVATRAVRAGE